MHLPQVVRIQALESDDVAETAALNHQAQHLRIPRVVDARLGHPSDSQRGQRTHELLGGFMIGDEVVVDEEEVAQRLLSNLVDYLGHRSHELPMAEVLGSPHSTRTD